MNIQEEINKADAVVIGAGAGLSTAAGFTYSGLRFYKYFSDFAKKYGIQDMYSGGFYPYEDLETFWAWWSRAIYINRYLDAPKNTYGVLYDLVKDKDYFVLTTNVDHQFQKHGFDKRRLFYTQGDYGLFQSSNPTIMKTYDNKEIIEKMLEAQGFIKVNGIYEVPKTPLKMRIPTEFIPYCPDDGLPMNTNLRCDDTFVEDAGWHAACKRYNDFIDHHQQGRVLYLELGVGMNTPVIIKYPFWKMTKANPQARYISINKGEAYAPAEIASQSLCINDDILHALGGE